MVIKKRIYSIKWSSVSLEGLTLDGRAATCLAGCGFFILCSNYRR